MRILIFDDEGHLKKTLENLQTEDYNPITGFHSGQYNLQRKDEEELFTAIAEVGREENERQTF
jgi:hypothetical protein